MNESSPAHVSALLVTLLSGFILAQSAQADIFQWEYINPGDHTLGKRQSAILAADGAGVNAIPGANLGSLTLPVAYLIGADLTGATARFANLTEAELSNANLTNVDFSGAVDEYNSYPTLLTGANLTRANASGA